MPPPRPTAGLSHFFFELDGVKCGFLKSVDGGTADGEVASGPGAGVEKKHISRVLYEDITIQAGFSMLKEFYDWISASLAGEALHSGSIITADANLDVVRELKFEDALITEIAIPAS